ncbi:pseudouridine-5-phosphate glycosidase [Thermoanaerobacterium thermosaccharolyticum]|jgi:pseudouridylate synthase|uniref:Pseudouridine-5'-phosphate glycosidase n=1 Tax=Thermoanaerobacterium thermosaccharolyticum (strain ATCC 7956 / DSM 571 / NCIMB 9385 / NCA 3814 / NCTC 13789 / WDCM 00135 / 2032) TaxID=580327 RepID=D9TQG9_THETC|nr:pseudouridine-5'-phosphate glycosidase [Thermoanaerobacterium thermosaccharolyticum]ADL69203.1 Indigoidine synthase A family protein [Thermoanaerobacterium thermosaccharolyticum DSM 571]MBE0068635.1 pseudouridine-5'-phosphate glycosidase [Thermoanaerobacterium thermosaccharolyticum]MBE0227587.1 pseudouridine-5'-phosphate glycosidase [Thermoanaerobacterium thermosaccharolyticum]PHO06323.1 pseudouridine-5-phosphate glycosidase [Thermoanaerobacterium thermosaccharolyticum]
MYKYLEINEEVKNAIDKGLPVVALESTIISHGMPYPENIKTANMLEDIVRDNGAVPATIAIIDGKIKIGINKKELEFLATSKDILKASRRDIPPVISKGLSAATTVSATMICASLAGIKIFVTGGIGGVHRGAEHTFDISADLQELAKTNVAVICSGAKAILDLPLTLEYLETQGVPVLGFKTDELPAFYTRNSGLKVDYMINDEVEAAKIIKVKWDIGLKGGLIIANPIPEEYSMNREYIEKAIYKALEEADANNIKGKKLTPFLLEKIKDITSGDSLKANIELVKNNAIVGAKIAVELNKLN